MIPLAIGGVREELCDIDEARAAGREHRPVGREGDAVRARVQRQRRRANRARIATHIESKREGVVIRAVDREFGVVVVAQRQRCRIGISTRGPGIDRIAKPRVDRRRGDAGAACRRRCRNVCGLEGKCRRGRSSYAGPHVPLRQCEAAAARRRRHRGETQGGAGTLAGIQRVDEEMVGGVRVSARCRQRRHTDSYAYRATAVSGDRAIREGNR